MKKVFLCGHTGSINRGCEAIVRSTVRILRKTEFSDDITLATFNPNDDKKLDLNKVVNLFEYNSYNDNKLSHYYSAIFNKVLQNYEIGQRFIQKNLWEKFDNSTMCLNIGGDTYCYKKPVISYGLNVYTSRVGVPNIFWCCSIEKECIDDEMIRDMNRYDLIMPRESITMENLINVGIPRNKLVQAVDPAFVLDIKKTKLIQNMDCKNTVGINISPVIIRHESKKNLAYDNFRNLIKYIISQTDLNIILVPHVYKENFQDDIPLTELYKEFFNTKRISIIKDSYSCEEIKYLISKCRFFIGARTHATIAAYSTCVPTLVLGYSVKSKGIAKDIFGNYKNYVLSTQNLNGDKDLINAFIWLMQKETNIRSHLNAFMPAYISRAWELGRELKKFVVDEGTVCRG